MSIDFQASLSHPAQFPATLSGYFLLYFDFLAMFIQKTKVLASLSHSLGRPCLMSTLPRGWADKCSESVFADPSIVS